MPQLDTEPNSDLLKEMTTAMLAQNLSVEDRKRQKERQRIWTHTRETAIDLAMRRGHDQRITQNDLLKIDAFGLNLKPTAYIKKITDPIAQTLEEMSVGWRITHLERDYDLPGSQIYRSAHPSWTALEIITLDTEEVLGTLFEFERKEWKLLYPRKTQPLFHSQTIVRGHLNAKASDEEVKAASLLIAQCKQILESQPIKNLF